MPDMDDAYANGAYIDGAADYPPRWAEAAQAFRDGLGTRAHLNLSYGPSDRMALDHFMPEGEAKGTLIFVHGGYWLKFDRSYWSHLATGALAHGWCVAMPSYDLCPTVRIAGITQQIAQAVMAVAEGSMGPISLAGHSAGGHLVARMLAPGMLPASVLSRLTHVMPISPVSDLEPLLETSMNADFGMDVGMARAESPMRQPKPDTPVTVWVGADERPVFLDQARWLAKAWGADHVVTKGEHHFNVIDALANPDSDMIQRLTTTP
ncbi:alpha/beta hydrolase [uncultured Tateyamaria sp.]|uniref:alpha/beta hydrolase n=1 Tax=uncultured Tateyamaria sp. TaxID=455651 RepID=UPI00262B68A5|nr:alpha/beta hydrolase [uncultured Tateyamaria sp.]